MALIKCPHCGKAMSDRAARCPHCGAERNDTPKATEAVEAKAVAPKPNEKTGNGLQTMFIAVAVLIVCGVGYVAYDKGLLGVETTEIPQESNAYSDSGGDGEGAQECLEKGMAYFCGDGVGQDYIEAVEWFSKAAEQGNSEAQKWLGVCYQKGVGVEKDYIEAAEWYLKAAEQGNADAQLELGMFYFYGYGVEQNAEEAQKWFRKAAANGNEIAQGFIK